MGRKTFESMKNKQLKNRVNYVITRKHYDNTESFTSLDECLVHIKKQNYIENVFIIGGYGLYEEAIKHHDCRYIYINVLDEDHECDVFFPSLNPMYYKLIMTSRLTSKIMKYIFEKN